MKLLSSLLISLIFVTSCNGQNKTQSQKIVSESKTISIGQPKMIKTQGSGPADNVHCGLRDKAGNLWFGTNDGVYCYNGTSFTRFLDNDSIINKNGLHLKRVEALLEDKYGNIWFASWDREGVCRYNGKSLTNFKPNGDETFKRILEDK